MDVKFQDIWPLGGLQWSFHHHGLCVAWLASSQSHRKSFTESKIYPQMKFQCLFSQCDYRCRGVDVFYDILSFNHHLHNSTISRYLMFRTWGTQTTIPYTDCGIHHFYLCFQRKRVIFGPSLPWQGMALHMPPVNGGNFEGENQGSSELSQPV